MKVKTGVSDGEGFQDEFCGCEPGTVKKKHKKRWINFATAVTYVLFIQRKMGFDPRRPKNRLAQAVFARIVSRLRLSGHKEDLRFYVCVGTCMDCLGVDCFFRYKDKIVTIDLYAGKREEKKKYINADLVLSRAHFVHNKHYQIADEIAKKLIAA